MKTSIHRITVVLVLWVASMLFVSTISADKLDVEREHKQDVVYQDESAAQAADIALLANETGLSVESLEQAMAFQEAFAKYAEGLIIRYPDQISAIWMEPVPSTKGHIQFVDKVPSEVTVELEEQGILNPDNFVLTGEGMISMASHARRAELAAEAILALGYQESMTFFDPVNNVIQIEIQLPQDAKQPGEIDIVTAVQNRIQGAELQGRATIVDINDLNLAIVEGSGSIVTLQHTRGGNWLRDDGVRECTSGWSVSGPNGDGIITAGHCNGLNQFEEVGGLVYGMTYKSGVFGLSGDVEYHTTTHVEYDDFYSDATTIRDVSGIKTTNTMVGGSVCVYGRASNVRTCNHTVEAINVTVNAGGTTVGKLVRASNVSTIGGDSGGGWSWDYTAWGVHHGIGGGKSYFMPVQEAQTALGVTVKTQ